MRVDRRCLLVLGCLLYCTARAPATTLPAGSLEVTADPVQPAGAPVIFTFIVRNSGTVPITYWRAGPGDFPDAGDFFAWVVRGQSAGPGRPALLSNGQSSEASGHAEPILPGRSKTFRAAMRPLPAGIYHIAVACNAQGRYSGGYLRVLQWPAMRTARSVTVEIRDDAALAAQLDKFIISGVRADDPFAAHLARTWVRLPVRQAIIKDLAGDDPIVADRAAGGLWTNATFADDQPPADLAPAVAEAIVHRLKPAADGLDDGLIRRLVNGAGNLQGLEITDALERLAAARPKDVVGDTALRFVAASQREIFFQRVHATPTTSQHDPAVLDSLLQLSRRADARARKVAYIALAEYGNNPAVLGALRAGVSDPDRGARYEAMMSLYGITTPRATTKP